MDWPELVTTLRQFGENVRVAGVGGDPDGDRSLNAYLDSPDLGFTPVLIDPGTGAITVRHPKNEWMQGLEAFHRNLLLGPWGRQLIAVSSMAMALLVVVGLVLWWPIKRGTFRRLRRRGDALSWHNFVGLVAAPFLILFVLTGVTLTYHKHIMPALHQLASGGSAPGSPIIAEPATFAPLETVFDAARKAVPGAAVRGFSEPKRSDEPYRIRMRHPGGFHPNGSLFVHVDPQTGKAISIRDITSESWASWYQHSWYSLHTGYFLPALPRAVWALAALAAALLALTGAWRWTNRRRCRDRRATGTTRPRSLAGRD